MTLTNIFFYICCIKKDMIVIGDVHGKVNQYNEIVTNTNDFTIQLGDFGFKTSWDAMQGDPDKNKVIMGNHDYYPYLYTHKHSVGDYMWWNNVFCIRGAYSVDKYLRTSGIDWFEEEEIPYATQLMCYDMYCDVKPLYVVSHDCPNSIANGIWGRPKNSTRTFLQALFDAHKPDVWVFGHHHESINIDIDGTTFVCLNELEIYKLF